MNYTKIKNPDDLLQHKDNPRFIQNQIIDYLINLKNPPSSLRYATRSQRSNHDVDCLLLVSTGVRIRAIIELN
jgi:hypothetical protein